MQLTGWVEQRIALDWVRQAELGLSPIPRGALFDVSSPTKVGEYLALGLPCVANDIPDQSWVLTSSGGGYCVKMEVPAFAHAVATLLDDPARARAMGACGQRWIRDHRSYEQLADEVASAYRTLLANRNTRSSQETRANLKTGSNRPTRANLETRSNPKRTQAPASEVDG